MTVDDLPLLATPKHAAKLLGVTDSQMRGLIRSKRIAHVLVGSRVMLPRDAIMQFIVDNTVQPCRDETRALVSASSTSAAVTTSSGQRAVAAGSAARALQIASKLKSPSPSSSTFGAATPGRVTPLRSS
ncbi:hypothetical protein CH340_05090 [Rhodoplanes serenus]|nr:hypothetical protein CH340_05090 [Rhodoplanes serenus]